MVRFWNVVNKVIKEADILLLVGDARNPEETFNEELYDKIIKEKKKFLYVLNKCDLTENRKSSLDLPYIFVSAMEHKNTLKLYKKIREITKGKDVTVGVLGYPNTGKSSIINAMKGSKSAPSSSQAGHTKGLQKIRVSKGIVLLDTPGVLPYREQDEVKHSHIASLSPNQMKDPQEAAYQLIEQNGDVINKFYKLTPSDDAAETLDEFAVLFNFVKKGGKPDTIRAAKKLLEDWQKGKIPEKA